MIKDQGVLKEGILLVGGVGGGGQLGTGWIRSKKSQKTANRLDENVGNLRMRM
jgi:hypothetical protein